MVIVALMFLVSCPYYTSCFCHCAGQAEPGETPEAIAGGPADLLRISEDLQGVRKIKFLQGLLKIFNGEMNCRWKGLCHFQNPSPLSSNLGKDGQVKSNAKYSDQVLFHGGIVI